jgi:hypothetical protein
MSKVKIYFTRKRITLDLVQMGAYIRRSKAKERRRWRREES